MPSRLQFACALHQILAGGDVWTGPEYRRTVLFSDRLKQTIDAAGLKTHALNFARTRVFQPV